MLGHAAVKTPTQASETTNLNTINHKPSQHMCGGVIKPGGGLVSASLFVVVVEQKLRKCEGIQQFKHDLRNTS